MAPETSSQIIYFISGMWCSTCAKTIRNSIAQLEGVESADLNYASKLLVVRFRDPALESALDVLIQNTVQKIGFGIKRQSKDWVLHFYERLRGEARQRIPWTQVSLVWFLAMWSSMIAFTGYMGGNLTAQELFTLALISSAFGLPAILIGLVPYAKSGLRALWFSRLLTLDLFIFLGGVSAFTVSVVALGSRSSHTYADSGSMIIAILLLTKKMESSVFTSMTSHLLYELHPKKTAVEVFRKAAWVPADPSQIKKNDLVRVPAQETIPFDGVLESEQAAINNHLMSGESHPVLLKKGDHLFAGAIAQEALQLSVTAPPGERKIDAWAETALLSAGTPSAYTRLFMKIESSLVVISFTGALGIALVRHLAGGGMRSVVESFFVGILIFCPCLFASILPLTKQLVHLGLFKAGILLGEDDALLKLSRTTDFCFDKTGTLEAVESVYIPQDESNETAVPYLKALSERSHHAILRNLAVSGESQALERIHEIPGAGLTATACDGAEIVVGKPAFLQEKGFNVAAYDPAFPLVAIRQKIVGQIFTQAAYDDKARLFLKDLLSLVPHSKIKILSGDPNFKAGEVFTRWDPRISYRGNLSPLEKADLITGASAFIGDGLNDTLALAKAGVSFRLGHRIQGFAPVDFQLRLPDMQLILDTIRYARKYRRVLIQTAAAAVLYNVCALTLAAFGKFSPLGAVLSMAASFSFMLLSILRLMKVQRTSL